MIIRPDKLTFSSMKSRQDTYESSLSTKSQDKIHKQKAPSCVGKGLFQCTD